MSSSVDSAMSSSVDSAMSSSVDSAMIGRFAKALEEATSTLFITGAGISADSGLPTYRGVGGIYEGAGTEDGVPIEVALSGPMFDSRPELTWKYISEIERACQGATPNAAHEVIARYQRSRSRAWVLTQNVDGFHGRAGSQALIEIHGTLSRIRCTDCPWCKHVQSFADLGLDLGTAGQPKAPRCPDCGAVVRPDVVLFEEMLPQAAVGMLEEQLALGFDVVVSVGTSSAFPYIVQPVLDAKAQGKFTIEINPARTELSGLVDLYIPARALPTFVALAHRMSL